MPKQWFATFGSAHLGNYRVDPMKIMVVSDIGEAHNAFRQRLMKEIGSDKFCTTYPISEITRMEEEWGLTRISMEGLKALKIKKQEFYVLTLEYEIHHLGSYYFCEDCEERLVEGQYLEILNELELTALKESLLKLKG